jgi:putative N6-adenine-specific DNA methylase
MEGNQYVASTFSGLEDLLATELIELGATDVVKLRRAVSFSGDEDIMYKVNYLSRLSLRVLKPIKEFTADTPQKLYDGAKSVDWMKIFDVGNTFAIDPVTSGNIFKHSQYAAQKVKDAIADQFRDRFGRRPDVDLDKPQIRIHLHIHEDQCTISLDSSGDSLHRRGYRLHLGPAPLSEVMASALIKISGWTPEQSLYDPMCGSGTILSEAVMIARNIPAGHYRKQFSFMFWPDYSRMRWLRIKKEADLHIRNLPENCHIAGSDLSQMAIEWTKGNLEALGVADRVELRQLDVRQAIAPGEKGILISNPPYGVRLKPEDIASLYRDVGNALKHHFPGWDAWLFSSDVRALKQTGMKPSQSFTLFNGPLECRYSHYEIRTAEFESSSSHQ